MLPRSCSPGLRLAILLALSSCQAYPFEARPAERSVGDLISQNVETLTPTDILFVIDDSGSMLAKRTELAHNIGLFVEAMAQSTFDYHVGIVTTDVECNVPERSCPGDGAALVTTSLSCCDLVAAAHTPLCADLDLNGDGQLDWTTCNGGRLRAPRGAKPYFVPPQLSDANAWAAAVSATILNLGCEGSGLEAGLEAARRAVNCAVYGFDQNQLSRCPSQAVAELNAGFVRPEADLVLIFVTDEDDCSFTDPTAYARPPDPSSAVDQAAHLCAPQECYAYYGADNDANQNGLQDWADPNTLSSPLLTCPDALDPGALPHYRSVNPPMPTPIATYLSDLIAAKGGSLARLRAAGIVSGVTDPTVALGLQATACTSTPLGSSNACGCWAADLTANPTTNFYCALTSLLNQADTPVPAQTAPNECSTLASEAFASTPVAGCTSMPGGRYVGFLQALAGARSAAGLRATTLSDSICRPSYAETINGIVNSVILTSCIALQKVPPSAASIVVQMNGVALPQVPVGSQDPGWSWVAAAPEICLEGGLKKSIGDTFAVYIEAA